VAGLAATVSAEVFKVKPVLANVCAVGFVKPDNVNVAAVEAARAQVPFNVMVTV
jgi:hypothetical protein